LLDKITNNTDYLNVESGSLSFTFYKSDCSIKIFPAGHINQNSVPVIDSYKILLKNANGSNNWVEDNLSNQACHVSYVDTGEDVIIKGVRSDNASGIFMTTYDLRSNGDVEASATFHNLANNGLKYSFTDMTTTPGSLVVNGLKYSVPTGLVNYEKNSVVIDNQTIQPLNNQVAIYPSTALSSPITITSGNTNFKYSTQETGTLLLTRVLENSTFVQTINDYSNVNQILPQGQSISLDPTFSYNSGSNYQIVTTQTTSSTCGVPSIKQSGFWDLTIPSSSLNAACTRQVQQFNINSLNNTIIDNVYLLINVTSVNNATSCSINNVQDQPSVSSATTLWNDITSGSNFVSNNNFCKTTGTSIVNLGPNGISAVQSRINNAISNNWFAVGIKAYNETRTSNTQSTLFSANLIQLGIDYHTALPSKPLNMLGVGHPHKNTITYTVPNSKGSSSITNYNLYRGSFPFAKVPLPDLKSSDVESYSSKLNMANNTALFHFETVTTPTPNTYHPIFNGSSGNGEYLKLMGNSTTGFNDTFSSYTIFNANKTYISNSSSIQIDTVNSNLKWTASPSTTPQNSYYDLQNFLGNGHSASDTSWILRFKFVVSGFAGHTSGDPPVIMVGLMNKTDSDPLDLTHVNAIFLRIPAITGNFISGVTSYNKDTANHITPVTTGLGTGLGTYYVQISRTGLNTASVKIFSDPTFTTLVGTANLTPDSHLTNLRYIVIWNDQGASFLVGDGVEGGTLDDLQFCNGCTSLVSPPINFPATNIKGMIGNSANFTLSSQFLNFSSTNPTIVPVQGTNSFSISTDIKKADTSNFMVLNYTNTFGNQIAFGVNNTYGFIKTGSSYILQSPSTIDINSQNQIAFSRIGNNWCYLVNGTIAGSCVTSSTSLATPNSNGVTIGYAKAMVDEYSIWNSGQSASFFANINSRLQNAFNLIKETGNVTSISDTGLGNGTNFYYKGQAINSNGNGTLSDTTNATTSTVPSAPISITLNIVSSNRIDISCVPPASNGGDPITGYQLKRNGTLLVNSTTSLCGNYSDTPINVSDKQNYTICAWNGVGCGPYISSNTNATASTSATITLHPFVIGDVIGINATTKINTGQPSPVILKTLKFYVNNTSYQNVTLNQNVAVGNSSTYSTFWYQFKNFNINTFRVQAIVSNLTGTVQQTFIPFNSANLLRGENYNPNYFIALTPSQGFVNYTTARSMNNTLALLNVNLNRNASLFTIECLYQTPSDIPSTMQQLSGGQWDNHSNIAAYAGVHRDPSSSQNIYVTCYDPNQLLFTTTIYSNATLLTGISYFDSTFKGFIGVPTGVFFLLIVAGLATGRTAPTIAVVLLAVAAIMTSIGFFAINQGVWGICLIAAACCLFGGKKFL